MPRKDHYHKRVEWSDEENTYIGRCPDVITGIHGDDPAQLCAELCEVVEEVLEHLISERGELPQKRARPMQEMV